MLVAPRCGLWALVWIRSTESSQADHQHSFHFCYGGLCYRGLGYDQKKPFSYEPSVGYFLTATRKIIYEKHWHLTAGPPKQSASRVLYPFMSRSESAPVKTVQHGQVLLWLQGQSTPWDSVLKTSLDNCLVGCSSLETTEKILCRVLRTERWQKSADSTQGELGLTRPDQTARLKNGNGWLLLIVGRCTKTR